MIKRILLSVGIIALLAGCSASAPNDVTLTTTPGVCVNSVVPSYEANQTTYSSAFPMNSYMPNSSPYCMAVTLTNNNSGQNSNNIQVYQGGLTLSFIAGGVSYSAYMIDFNAAGLYPSNFNYTPVQQLGNVALFDPNNCVTTIGAHVNTLNKGGGQCTFYLQIVSEYMPTGDYPLNLSINYTNGNQNYNVQTNVYEHSNMYIGGNFSLPSNNIARFNANTDNLALPMFESIANPVQLLAQDSIGNVYAYDGSNIFVYNGESILQSIAAPYTSINQLTGDSFGNLFAATGNGLYVYSAANGASKTWLPVTNITGVVNALQANNANGQDILYITSGNGVESCVYTSNNQSCTPTLINAGSGYNNAALSYNESTNALYWATSNAVFVESAGSLTQFSVSGTITPANGPLGLDPLGFVYAASTGSNPAAVYANLASVTQLSPLLDNESNLLIGDANGVLVRSYTYASTSPYTLYSYGSGLQASALPPGGPSGGAYLAYINMVVNTANYYAASSAWTPILGLNGQVNSVVVSSRLANN